MTKDEAREKLIEEQFEGPIKFGPLACKSTFKSGLEIGFDAGYSAAANQWKRISVDGLPPEAMYCAVSVDDEPGGSVTIPAVWSHERQRFEYCGTGETVVGVIAWRPLPEYTGEV
jgi:hypothetical protein